MRQINCEAKRSPMFQQKHACYSRQHAELTGIADRHAGLLTCLSAHRMFLVDGTRGRCREMTSDSRSSCSLDTYSAPSSSTAGFLSRSCASTLEPNPCTAIACAHQSLHLSKTLPALQGDSYKCKLTNWIALPDHLPLLHLGCRAAGTRHA